MDVYTKAFILKTDLKRFWDKFADGNYCCLLSSDNEYYGLEKSIVRYFDKVGLSGGERLSRGSVAARIEEVNLLRI